MTNDNKNVTKQDLTDLEERLDKKLTDKLNKSFEAFRVELAYQFAHQFKMQDERWERRFLAFESRMYNLIDPLLKEMETRQQDRELTTAQIKNLDRRVTKLEKAQ